MTEAEWLACSEQPVQLRVIEEYATIRKLRLIAAAFVRRVQSDPDLEERDAKRCDDLIEAVADCPVPWEELEPILRSRYGHWRFTHMLPPGDLHQITMELRKLLAFTSERHQPYSTTLIHEVIGNPFRPVAFDPSWRTSAAVALARQMYEARDFAHMPILADALQDAGSSLDP